MRLLLILASVATIYGCASAGRSYVDDRPTIGVQPSRSVCSSGPNGKTAACATAVVENAIIHGSK